MLKAENRSKHPRLESTAVALCLAVILVSLFAPLLTSPRRFPSVPATQARPTHSQGSDSDLLYQDLVAQSGVFRKTGQVPYLDIVGDTRRSRATAPTLFTHPVFFFVSPLLGNVFPLEVAATLFLLVHLFVGALAVYFLARRLSVDGVSATFGAAIFVVSGRLVDSATTPSEVGLVQCAALTPAVLVLMLRMLEVPTVLRGIFLGLSVGWLTCSADLVGVLSATLSVTLTAPVLLQRSHAEYGRQHSPVHPALILVGSGVWGISLGAYRWLPVVWGGDVQLAHVGNALMTPWWYGFESVQLPFHLGAVTLVLFLLGARRALLDSQAGLLWLASLALVTITLGPLSLLPFFGLPLALVSAKGVSFRGERPALHPTLQHLASAAVLILLLLEAIPVQHQLLWSSDHRTIVDARQIANPMAPEIIARNSSGDRPVHVRTSIDRWDVSIETSEPTLLVGNLDRLDGLTANVDGMPATLVDAGNRLGVSLTSGTHEVTLAFSPPGLEHGQVASAIALLLLPFLVFATFFRLRPNRLEYRRARRQARTRRRRRSVPRPAPSRAPVARHGARVTADLEKAAPLTEVVGNPPGLRN